LNYLQQILAFNDYLLYEQKLSSGQIALWHALHAINNKAGWANWFTAANLTLESLSGLSRPGVLKARNVLKQLNLIDFSPNGKNKATSYHLRLLYIADSKQQSNARVISKVTQQEQNSTPLFKLNETETKTNIYTGADTREDFTINVWPEYPKKQKFEEAFESYGHALEAGATKEQIVKGMKRYAQYVKAKHWGDGYIAMPANWLDARRWLDDYDMTPENPNSSKRSKGSFATSKPNDSFSDSDLPF